MSSDDLLGRARAALATAERERVSLKATHRAEIAECDAEISRLKGAVRALTTRREPRTAAVQAGPKALDAVRRVLADGPLPQNRIVHVTGINDGTVSYALRALLQTGEIRATGKLVDGSREFKLRKTRGQASAA